MKMMVDHKYLIIAIAASFVGANARISFERDTQPMTRAKYFRYYSMSLLVGYLIYDMLHFWEWQGATGFASAIGGLISIDIIKLIIEKLPNMLMSKARKVLDVDDKIKNDELD